MDNIKSINRQWTMDNGQWKIQSKVTLLKEILITKQFSYFQREQTHKKLLEDNNQSVGCHYILLIYKFLDEIVVQFSYDSMDIGHSRRN